MTASTVSVCTLGKITASTKVTGTMVNSMVTAFTDKLMGRRDAADGKKGSGSRGLTNEITSLKLI